MQDFSPEMKKQDVQPQETLNQWVVVVSSQVAGAREVGGAPAASDPTVPLCRLLLELSASVRAS